MCLILFFLQWDLVCSNQWKVPFASSTLFVGYLFGSLISGQFSDRYFYHRLLSLDIARGKHCNMKQNYTIKFSEHL